MKSKVNNEISSDVDQTNKIEEIIDDFLDPVEDTLCCVGSCRREKGGCQLLASSFMYLVISSVIALVQGMFFTYSNAVLSTIEKDFALPSRLSGLTTTGNDVLTLILAVPLSFYTSRGHRPRWVAFGMLLSVVSCVIAASPHFIFPDREKKADTSVGLNYDISANITDNLFCVPTDDVKCSIEDNHSNSEGKTVVILLLVAQMLSGIGSLLYYTIGYSYMDESVDQAKVPILLGISRATRLIGPACGYSLAYKTLSMWKNPFEEPPSDMNPSHPRWIGAWWIGYLIIGAILLAITWALFFLPKTLPATRKRKRLALLTAAEKGQHELVLSIKKMRPKNIKWMDIPSSMKRLSLNKFYRLLVLKEVIFWFAYFGYLTFKSKYIEHQFRMSPSQANKSIATISLFASIFGSVATGVSFYYFKPSAKKMILYSALLMALQSACNMGQMYVSCDLQEIIGTEDVTEFRSSKKSNIVAQNISFSFNKNSTAFDCVTECGCQVGQFSPVCLRNSSVYYNSCFARCSRFEGLYVDPKSHGSMKDEVSSGFCPSNCPSFSTYVIISVVAKMINIANRVPANVFLLRAPEERDKDVGLGLFNSLYSLGSSIPSPILFGLVIDLSCELWGESCKSSKLCWLYNLENLRYIVHGFPAVAMIICFLIDLRLLKYHDTIELYSPETKERDSKTHQPTEDMEEITTF